MAGCYNLQKEVRRINPKILKVNQRLEILVDSTQQESAKYSSRIEGIADNRLYLAMPMKKGVPVFLLPGTKFRGRFIAHESAWQFFSTYLDKRIMPVPIWITSLPDELEKVQLRAHVRIHTVLNAKISVITDNGELPPETVSTKDISGGGMQIVSPAPVNYGAKLRVALDLPEYGGIKAIGEVVRVDRLNDAGVYWIALRFTEIAEKDREKIIKFVFRLQIERRQKGL